MMTRTGPIAAALVLLALGCDSAPSGSVTDATVADSAGQDATTDAGADSAGQPDAGGSAPDYDSPASQLTLELADWGLSFQGAVLDGPRVSYHIEAERDGQCRLLTYEPAPCDPACDVTEVCAGSTCVAQPGLLSAGTLELTGFPGGAITIEPTADGQYFFQTEDVNGDDAESVTLTSSGGDVPAFTLKLGVVSAPVAEGDWAALLSARGPGEDVTLTWTDATFGARIYLRMTTGVGTHGGISHAEVECEGPDTGSLRLPGSFLDALFAEGWSCGECGDNKLWRYLSDTSDTTPPVQLRVQSRATFYHHPNFN